MTFYRETTVKAIRKARPCFGCSRMIGAGESALDVAGHWDGDFWSGSFHHECRAAEIALNRFHGLHPDEWQNLSDIEWDDWGWLLAEHPVVASRMGVTAEGLQKVEDEWAQRWASCKAKGTPA